MDAGVDGREEEEEEQHTPGRVDGVRGRRRRGGGAVCGVEEGVLVWARGGPRAEEEEEAAALGLGRGAV